MPDYSKGKIYSIRSHQTDDVYIGSTTQSLAMRMAGHRRAYKHSLKPNSTYITSFKIIQFKDAYIELVEKYPCKCREELNKREGEIMRETKRCVNRCIAGRTRKQYRDEHKKQAILRSKRYQEKNKEKIEKRRSQKLICDCGGKFRRDYKPKHERTKLHQKYIEHQISQA